VVNHIFAVCHIRSTKATDITTDTDARREIAQSNIQPNLKELIGIGLWFSGTF
jgi:hypothetical protein